VPSQYEEHYNDTAWWDNEHYNDTAWWDNEHYNDTAWWDNEHYNDTRVGWAGETTDEGGSSEDEPPSSLAYI
jgi:hypothetical protein